MGAAAAALFAGASAAKQRRSWLPSQRDTGDERATRMHEKRLPRTTADNRQARRLRARSEDPARNPGRPAGPSTTFPAAGFGGASFIFAFMLSMALSSPPELEFSPILARSARGGHPGSGDPVAAGRSLVLFGGLERPASCGNGAGLADGARGSPRSTARSREATIGLPVCDTRVWPCPCGVSRPFHASPQPQQPSVRDGADSRLRPQRRSQRGTPHTAPRWAEGGGT